MRSLSCKALVECRAPKLIEQLGSRDVSVLESLGAHKLRLEMSLVGRLCQFIVWLILLGPRSKRSRKQRAAKWVRFFFPVRFLRNNYTVKKKETAIVVYFNHQSLFEVLAAIHFCMTTFPEKKYLFPVNLPWYEGLCPVLKKLDELDVCITPMITPSTREKLRSIAESNEETLNTIETLKKRFEEQFGDLTIAFLKSGELVAVAPSATRTKYIFPSYETYTGIDKRGIKEMPRSMEAIVLSLMRSRLEGLDVEFIPFVATREKRAGRGLNVWIRHDVYVGDPESLEVMLVKLKDRTLQYDCYLNLAKFVPEDVKYDHSGIADAPAA